MASDSSTYTKGDEDSAPSPLQPLLDFIADPGKAFSCWMFGLGVWATLLGILNILFGLVAYKSSKVVWAGVLTLGNLWPDFDAVWTGVAESYRPMSDTVFMLLAVTALVWGGRGIHRYTEGGIQTWMRGLVTNPLWFSLLSSKEKGGWSMTLAAWCLILGIGLYIMRGIVYWNWVDPGVYAVCAPLVAFGFALKFSAEADATEASQD